MNGPDKADTQLGDAADPIGEIALPGTDPVGVRARALAGITTGVGVLGMVVGFSSLTSSLHANPF